MAARKTLGASRAPPNQPTKMDVEHAFKRRDWNAAWIARVQKLVLAYPEVVEAEQFGGPWWKAGANAFCFYGGTSLKVEGGYRGVDGVGVKVPLPVQRALVQDARFERATHIGQHGWTILRFDGRAPDWSEVAGLVDVAYRNVANKRMLAALDEFPSKKA